MDKPDQKLYLEKALEFELKQISRIDDSVLQKIIELVNIINLNKKNIIITGIGKSGLIANRIASSIGSLSFPAFYFSVSDLLHGSLGTLKNNDVLIVFSKSGNSGEIDILIEQARLKDCVLIGIGFNDKSSLALKSELFIDLKNGEEHKEFYMVPSISLSTMNVIGNLIITLLAKLNKFSSFDFQSNHPSGSVGKRLNLPVAQVMIDRDKTAMCDTSMSMIDVVSQMTRFNWGVVIVFEGESVVGLITDGDLRRGLNKYGSLFLDKPITDIVNKEYTFVESDVLIHEALKLMETPIKQISVIPVIDKSQYMGIIRLHDILTQM